MGCLPCYDVAELIEIIALPVTKAKLPCFAAPHDTCFLPIIRIYTGPPADVGVLN